MDADAGGGGGGGAFRSGWALIQPAPGARAVATNPPAKEKRAINENVKARLMGVVSWGAASGRASSPTTLIKPTDRKLKNSGAIVADFDGGAPTESTKPAAGNRRRAC
jgi:hypothetical protein